MATFLTTHSAPPLDGDAFNSVAAEIAESLHATFITMYANTKTGNIVTVYEAENTDALESEFERLGYPFDEIREMDVTLDAANMKALAAGNTTN